MPFMFDYLFVVVVVSVDRKECNSKISNKIVVKVIGMNDICCLSSGE